MDNNRARGILEGVLGEVATQCVEVGVSNRHIHLSKEDLEGLFGPEYELGIFKELKQPGHFAAKEKLEIAGPKGSIKNVRVLGPLRKATQVEILASDGYKLGVIPPVRESGSLDDTPGIELVGPAGRVTIKRGVIAAKRHIHMPEFYANVHKITDGEEVSVESGGVRGCTLKNVSVRVSNKVVMEMHIDNDEANATGIKNGDLVRIIRD